MEVVAFEPWHLHSYEPGVFDRLALADINFDVLAEKADGKAVSIRDGDRTLGLAGVTQFDDGRLEGWLFGSDDLRQAPFFLHRSMKRALPVLVEVHGLQGLEVRVSEQFVKSLTWVRRLGFNFVGFGANGFVRYRL